MAELARRLRQTNALVSTLTEDMQRMGGMEALDAPYVDVPIWQMVQKRAGWLAALFLGEMLTATAMGHFEDEIARAVVLALFVPLIISSGGNSGSQGTSLIIRAFALRELKLGDWAWVLSREIVSGLALGTMLGAIGFARIVLWQETGWADYGTHYLALAVTVWVSLIGVVGFGAVAGSMLPFLLRRLGLDPATSSAPFVATLVDVTGLVIYFTVASIICAAWRWSVVSLPCHPRARDRSALRAVRSRSAKSLSQAILVLVGASALKSDDLERKPRERLSSRAPRGSPPRVWEKWGDGARTHRIYSICSALARPVSGPFHPSGVGGLIPYLRFRVPIQCLHHALRSLPS